MEGKDGYDPSLKIEQTMEIMDTQKLCGDTVETIRLINLAAIEALSFVPMTVTDAIVYHQRTSEEVYCEARIKLVALQTPLVVKRCPKLYVVGANAGKQCLSPVVGGKCRRIHMTSMVGEPIAKLSAWMQFLDADLARSVQRRAFLRPNALSQITGIKEDELIAMTAGDQEMVAKAIAGQIFVARFIVASSYLTCCSFTQ